MWNEAEMPQIDILLPVHQHWDYAMNPVDTLMNLWQVMKNLEQQIMSVREAKNKFKYLVVIFSSNIFQTVNI